MKESKKERREMDETESKQIEAFVPMEIPTVTHNDLLAVAGKRYARIIKSTELHEAEAKWEAHLGSAIEKPEKPLDGPLMARVQFCFSCLDGKHRSGEPHVDKPDADNLEKTFWDVCKRLGFIKDDSLIFSKIIEKRWSNPPGVYLCIKEGTWHI